MCEGEETLDNLFTKCPFARALWFDSPLNIKADSIPSVHQWLKMISEDYKADHVHGMSLVQKRTSCYPLDNMVKQISIHHAKLRRFLNRMAKTNRTGGTEQIGSQ